MDRSEELVLVIGAGVIGLQTALTLLRASYRVTLIAECLPGDSNSFYTSPWAGAHWRTHATKEEKELCEWDTETYRTWEETVKREEEEGRAGESGLGVLTSLHYWDAPAPEIANGSASLWWSSVVSGFKVLPASQLPAGVHYGVSFSTFAINVPIYLLYLQSSIERLGGKFIRSHIPTTDGLHGALSFVERLSGENVSIFVNATGIGANELVGDNTVNAIRGQTVLVKGEANFISTRLGNSKNDVQAIIPRPGSGTTIVGVTREPNIWDTAINHSSAKRILEHGRALAPELLNEDGEFDVLKVQVGLRPSRKNGPRVELEALRNGKIVIHEYGHSGAGYQNSVGSANKVLRLLQEHQNTCR